MKVCEILNKAADLLEKPGAWTQGEYSRGDGCFCLVGAVTKAAGFSPHEDDQVRKVEDDVRFWKPLQAVTGWDKHPYRWNDAMGRTQAEVVSALREAAAKAQQSNN